jgi:hypothetical protein
MVTSSADVERAIAIGRELKLWWMRVDAGRVNVERFQVAPEFQGGRAVSGFFGAVHTGGNTHDYMGYESEYFFDLAGHTPAEARQAAPWLVDQAEMFALRYWLRSEAWALPEPYEEISRPADRDVGGYMNLMQAFKSRNGTMGRFSDAEARAIVDLRELETTYQWITLSRSGSDLRVSLTLPGSSSLRISAPFATSSKLALHADLTVHRRLPAPGVLAEFGVGFSPIPPAGVGSLVMDFDFLQTGLRLQTLRVHDDGQITLQTVTIMRRVPAPLEYFVKPLLCEHATLLRDKLLGTRSIWQQASNWLDESSIPRWLRKGTHT